MSRYRKKPVVITAHKWMGRTLADRDQFAAETGFPKWPLGSRDGMSGMLIPTLEGDMIAEQGDWIVRGVKGEYYPCKPDIFTLTYEPIEEASDG